MRGPEFLHFGKIVRGGLVVGTLDKIYCGIGFVSSLVPIAYVKRCKGVRGSYCIVLFSAYLHNIPRRHVLIRFYCNVLTVVVTDCLPAVQLGQSQNTASVCACMPQVTGLSPLQVTLVTKLMGAALGKLLLMFLLSNRPGRRATTSNTPAHLCGSLHWV